MGRSQYLLNRSKQRFKKIHGGRHLGDSLRDHHSTSGGDDNSSTEETPSAPSSSKQQHHQQQGYQQYQQQQQPQYHHHHHHQQQPHHHHHHHPQHHHQETTTPYVSQPQVPLQQQDERQFQQHRKHRQSDENDHSYGSRRQQISEAVTGDSNMMENHNNASSNSSNDQQLAGADLSWSFSGQTSARDEKQQQQQQQQSLQQQFERQKYEHEQQKLQLRQEQLRQQEQLRWQQHQLQLQQDQIRQQEHMRQMRQQQQIRNQKLHHQQRHQYQMQQKQLREQQKQLEQQYQQQLREHQEGAKRQVEKRRHHHHHNDHDLHNLDHRELRREDKKEEMRKPRLRKGWWRRQQQMLTQLDDEESLYDLHKTISRQRPENNNGYMSSGMSVSSHNNQIPGKNAIIEGKRRVGIDVRSVSEALTFLDRASRLQIPEHLAATLESFSATTTSMPRGSRDVTVREAIAVRQGQNSSSAGLYGGGKDFATLQQSYSAKSTSSGGLSASYSRHQQNAALSTSYNNISGGLSGGYHHHQQAFPGYQQNTLPGLHPPLDLPHYQQNALPAYPKKLASGRHQHRDFAAGSQEYDFSGGYPQMHSHEPYSQEARSKTSALSVSSSSSRSLEPKSTVSQRDTFDDTSYNDTTYSASIRETITKTQQQGRGKDVPPVSSYGGFEPQTETTMTMTSKMESAASMNGMSTGPDGKNIPGGSFQDSYRTPDLRQEKHLPDVTTPQHKNDGIARLDPEPTTPNFSYGLSPNSESPSPKYFTTDGEESTIELQEVVSPSTIGVSVVTDGPAPDEAPSFPSLRITEAFTYAASPGKEKTLEEKGRDPQSSGRANRAPAGSPSPSEVLMTYTVTDGGDESSESVTKSNSNPSRRSSSGISSLQSRQSAIRGKLTPPREPKAGKTRHKTEAKDSRFLKQDTSQQSPEDLRLPSSQDHGNEPPYLPPSSGRSLMDHRSTGGSRSEDAQRHTQTREDLRSPSRSKSREDAIPEDSPRNPSPYRGPRDTRRAPSADGDTRLSVGGRPQSSAGSRSAGDSLARDSRDRGHDSQNSNVANVNQMMENDGSRRRQETPRSQSRGRPRGVESNQGFADEQRSVPEDQMDPRFDHSFRDPSGMNRPDDFSQQSQEFELDPLQEPVRSNETSKNSRSTHASLYEPIHPYEPTRNKLMGRFDDPSRPHESPRMNPRASEHKFADPMTSRSPSRQRRVERDRYEVPDRSSVNARQTPVNSYYEDPSSTRAVARPPGGNFDFEATPRYSSSDGFNRRNERVRHDHTDHTGSTLSSRRTVGQYRHSGDKQNAYNLDAPFSSEYDEESTTSISGLTGRGFLRNSLHHSTMADYEDASNSIIGEGTNTGEDESIFSSGRSILTTDRSTLVGHEATYAYEKDGNEAFFMDVQTLGGHHHPVRKETGPPSQAASSTTMNVRTIRTAYASMTKALAKERYAPVGYPGKRTGSARKDHTVSRSRGSILPGSHPSSERGKKKNMSKEDEEDLDKWLESAMESKSADDGGGIEARQFGEGDEADLDAADLDAWLDNVICR